MAFESVLFRKRKADLNKAGFNSHQWVLYPVACGGVVHCTDSTNRKGHRSGSRNSPFVFQDSISSLVGTGGTGLFAVRLSSGSWKVRA